MANMPPFKTRRFWDTVIARAGTMLDLVPGRYRAVAAAALVLAAAVVAAVFYAPDPDPDSGPQPYAATAIMAPVDCDWQVADDCVARDVNLIVTPGEGAKLAAPFYDESGHASLASTFAQLAPRMGWPVAFMDDVAAKVRPIYYCAAERRAWDAAHPGFDTAAIGYWSLVAILEPFDVLPVEENCEVPDLVMGANAESDCGPGAWGCAALWFQGGSRAFVRVTFNGSMLAGGLMPVSAVRVVDWHEDKHAADLGHTGEYGGEGRSHAHPSDMGFICVQVGRAFPCDNPGDAPAIEDWHEPYPGQGFRYGLQLKQAPPPPPPPPPTCTARVVFQEWAWNGAEWVVVNLAELDRPVPTADSRWWVVIVDGEYSSFPGKHCGDGN